MGTREKIMSVSTINILKNPWESSRILKLLPTSEPAARNPKRILKNPDGNKGKDKAYNEYNEHPKESLRIFKNPVWEGEWKTR